MKGAFLDLRNKLVDLKRTVDRIQPPHLLGELIPTMRREQGELDQLIVELEVTLKNARTVQDLISSKLGEVQA